ncbi:MAG: CoA ester lyase [Alphaproteobacteria bacterium]|nr:CoA ester lyase [Alphaproteobacteria bacterium]
MTDALRSFLFVPANQPTRIPKALSSGADAVILDLEDTVPASEKPAARAEVRAAFSLMRDVKLYVRINAINTPHCYADLIGTIGIGLDGVVVPKIESASHIHTIDWLLRQLEAERGVKQPIDLLPIVETAAGIVNLDAIANASPRVRRLTFGAGDLMRDLGQMFTGDEIAIADARARITLASRAAGREPPIDTVYLDVRNLEGIGKIARQSRVLGFQGKLCIHPDQVAVVNAAFTPSAEEVARAERVLAAFAKSEAKGIASIEVDGGFVDYPIVAQAERILALAKRSKRQ